MYLKLFYTKNQFLKYNMNLGSLYINLNRNNSYYTLGIYFNHVLINLNIFLFKLKKNIDFVLTCFLKNKNINYIVINTLQNKIIHASYVKMYKKHKTNYFAGTWWNGFLKSFKKFLKYKSKKSKQYFSSNNLLPFCALYLNQEKFHKKNLSAYNFHNEINTTSIFSFMFVSTTVNSYEAPNVLFQNTRNLLNNYFLNKFFLSLLKKSLFCIKKKFCYFVFNNFKIFFLKNLKEIFFENFFCLIYKKNFLKFNKWSGDLK